MRLQGGCPLQQKPFFNLFLATYGGIGADCRPDVTPLPPGWRVRIGGGGTYGGTYGRLYVPQRGVELTVREGPGVAAVAAMRTASGSVPV